MAELERALTKRRLSIGSADVFESAELGEDYAPDLVAAAFRNSWVSYPKLNKWKADTPGETVYVPSDFILPSWSTPASASLLSALSPQSLLATPEGEAIEISAAVAGLPKRKLEDDFGDRSPALSIAADSDVAVEAASAEDAETTQVVSDADMAAGTPKRPWIRQADKDVEPAPASPGMKLKLQIPKLQIPRLQLQTPVRRRLSKVGEENEAIVAAPEEAEMAAGGPARLPARVKDIDDVEDAVGDAPPSRTPPALAFIRRSQPPSSGAVDAAIDAAIDAAADAFASHTPPSSSIPLSRRPHPVSTPPPARVRPLPATAASREPGRVSSMVKDLEMPKEPFRLNNVPTPTRSKCKGRSSQPKARDSGGVCGLMALSCLRRDDGGEEPISFCLSPTKPRTQKELFASQTVLPAPVESSHAGSFGGQFHDFFVQTRAYFESATVAPLSAREPPRRNGPSLCESIGRRVASMSASPAGQAFFTPRLYGGRRPLPHTPRAPAGENYL